MPQKKKKEQLFIEKCRDKATKYYAQFILWISKHKKLVRKTLILTSMLIICLLIFTIISVNVKLLFDTETHISLSPAIQSITLEEKESTNVTFITSVSSLNVCAVYCSYTLLDANTNTVILQETLLAPKQKISNLPLLIPEIGAGQKIYNYKVNCTTTQRTLCPSKGKTYEKTAFLTLNYPLSAEEEALQEKLLPLLVTETEKLAYLKMRNEELQAKTTIIKNYSNSNISTNELLFSVLEYASIDESELLHSWGTEQFSETKKLLTTFTKTLELIDERIRSQEKKILSEQEFINQSTLQLYDIYAQRNSTSTYTSLLKTKDNVTYNQLVESNILYEELLSNQENYTPREQINLSTSILIRITQARLRYEEIVQEKSDKEEEILALYETQLLPLSYPILFNCSNTSVLRTIITNYDALFNTTTSTTLLDEYELTYCMQNETKLFMQEPHSINFTLFVDDIQSTIIPLPQAQCTYNGITKACESEKNMPIILVHGHSFSRATTTELAFTRLLTLQEFLAKDGYINAGTFNSEADIDSVSPGDWSQNPAPIVIGVTYYYLQHYNLGTLSFTTRKTDRIENYALRLKESIDVVKEKTRSDQVIIIAHSMGGLVARSYMDIFGDDDVYLLITLGTPNYGVEGDIESYCTLTGARNECEDMSSESPFLKNLNKERNNPKTTKVYTIAATGCPTKNNLGGTETGDGVVLERSVALDFADNYVVNGKCTDVLQKDLHMNFVNPKLYPETYELIKKILDENN